MVPPIGDTLVVYTPRSKASNRFYSGLETKAFEVFRQGVFHRVLMISKRLKSIKKTNAEDELWQFVPLTER
jgi:hypothetical protein